MCKYSENHSPDSFDNVKTAFFFLHSTQILFCGRTVAKATFDAFGNQGENAGV